MGNNGCATVIVFVCNQLSHFLTSKQMRRNGDGVLANLYFFKPEMNEQLFCLVISSQVFTLSFKK